MTTTEAIARIKDELGGSEDVDLILNFIKGAQRGIILARG